MLKDGFADTVIKICICGVNVSAMAAGVIATIMGVLR